MAETLKIVQSLAKDFYWVIRPAILIAVWYCADNALKKLTKRFFTAASERIKSRVTGTAAQRMAAQRALTLYHLTTQVLRGVIAAAMIFLLLDMFGIDMRPVMAGVGVVGLALSLAAQNIIRDYITGCMILFEDQFNVGDFINAGGFSGTVEAFSLRATKLRDIAGSLIIIPNSAIQTVQNYNKIWSAALVDIAISYESDYKKALNIAAEIAAEMAEDQANGIIETPVTQGIVTFNDNAVMLRTIIKTDPGQQWVVGRIYRQKLKDAYDANGIVFAHPRLIVHAPEDGGSSV